MVYSVCMKCTHVQLTRADEEKPVSRLITWNKQKDFAFVICPHGGGLDCHRNWEALCLGCIPIVKTSKIDNLYKDLSRQDSVFFIIISFSCAKQKLNPDPTDPIQAKIFAFFPLFLTIILASFPSGLVVYWTINNILTIAQQWVINKNTTVKTN